MEFLKGVFTPGGADRELRRQLIKEMHERIPEVCKIETGKYSLILRSPNGQVNTLSITLIGSFPTMKPIFSVRGPLQHPWIDQYRFVTGSNILNMWDSRTKGSLSLADAIIEVKDVLECGYELNDPSQATSGINGINNRLAALENPGNVYISSNQNQQEPPEPAHLTTDSGARTSSNSFTPDIPSEFPKLEELTDVQLMRLLDDEVAFDLFVEEQHNEDDMTRMRKNISLNNVKAARKNLSKEGDLTTLHDEVNQLQDVLQVELAKYDEKLSVYSKDHTLNRADLVHQLEKLADEIDMESEGVGDLFVNGETPMAAFLKEYMQKRTRYHALNAKLEALG